MECEPSGLKLSLQPSIRGMSHLHTSVQMAAVHRKDSRTIQETNTSRIAPGLERSEGTMGIQKRSQIGA